MMERKYQSISLGHRLHNIAWVIRHRSYSTLGYIFVRTWCKHLVSNMAYRFFRELEESESIRYAWIMTWHPKFYKLNKSNYDACGY